MRKIVVTAGETFTDIDSLASALAYREANPNSLVVLPNPLNQSVTPTIKTWKLDFSPKIENGDNDFVVVDVSDPQHIPKFVNQEKIIEIYDHHPGFEKYWLKKLGPRAHIETIGACATLIWEEFKRRQPNKKVGTICANLIYTAIFSNTLNFKASVTTKKDKIAFRELKPYINLPENWFEQYYQEVESEIYQNPVKSILNDTKTIEIKGVEYTVGQIELWASQNFVGKYLKEIENALTSFGNQNWFFTSPSISEGKNYIYTKNEAIKRRLKEILDLTFDGNLGTTNKLWLRKEILKKLQN